MSYGVKEFPTLSEWTNYVANTPGEDHSGVVWIGGDFFKSEKTGKLTPQNSAKLSNILSKSFTGACQSPAWGGYTFNVQMMLAAKPLAVRLILSNVLATTPITSAAIGFDSDLGAILSAQSKGANVSTWYPITFSGSATGTHTAAANSQQPSYLTSDWIPVDAVQPTSGNMFITHLRILQGVSGELATINRDFYTASSAIEAVCPNIFRSYQSLTAADYVTTNQSSFPANSGNPISNFVPFILQYVSASPGKTLLIFGDSIAAGISTSGNLLAQGYGWGAKVRDALDAITSYPVELCNLGWGGQQVYQYYARYNDLASKFQNHTLFWFPFTPNSMSIPLNYAGIVNCKNKYALAKILADQNNCEIVLHTATPANASVAGGGLGGTSTRDYASGDQYRVAWNNELLASGMNIFDIDALARGNYITSGTDAGQWQYGTGLTIDGLHPNDTLYTTWANNLNTYLINTLF